MATYYFSSTGSDSNSGTTALSPWQTSSKFNAIFSSLNGGDQVLFKRGDIFPGPFVISKSGINDNHIRIGAYDTGANPIWTGLVTPTWTNLGANVWQSNIINPGSRLKIVTISGAIKPMARTNGWSNIASFGGSGSSSFLSGNLPTGTNWTGAEIVIRKREYIVDKHPITGQSGNTITYNASNAPMAPDATGFGYFIQNDVRLLAAPGDWYYDNTTKVLKMYNTSNPSGLTVKAAFTQDLVTIVGRSYVDFTNIDFVGANGYVIKFDGGDGVVFDGCKIQFAGDNGIETWNATNFYYINGTISDTNNNGGYLRCSNSFIQNNTITRCGMNPGLGREDNQAHMGILVTGANNTIENNYIHTIGYIPVYFNGNNVLVTKNRIDNYCLMKTDGGGIYASGNESGNTVNREVSYNIVTNGIGDQSGTPYGVTGACAGIYMDDNTTNVNIHHNSVKTMSRQGIFLHNTQNITVTNNVVSDARGGQFALQHNQFNGQQLDFSGITVNNNTFVAIGTQNVLNLTSINDNIGSWGTWNNNLYTRLSGTTDTVYKIINNVSTTYSLAAWKSAYGKDSTTVAVPAGFTSTSQEDIIQVTNPTNSSATQSLSGQYKDITGSVYNGTITLAPFGSNMLYKTANIASSPPKMHNRNIIHV